MNRTKKFVATVVIILMILLVIKSVMIAVGEYYMVNVYVDNFLIITSVSMLLGGVTSFFSSNLKSKNAKRILLAAGVIITSPIAYFMAIGWFIVLKVNSVGKIWLENFFSDFMYSKESWTLMIFAALIFIITCLFLGKRTVYINASIGKNTYIRKEVDNSRVSYIESRCDSLLARNMICLKKYDYAENLEDLSFFEYENMTSDKINPETDKFYIVEYDEKPVGYFAVRKNSDTDYEITDIYGSYSISRCFQFLNVALRNYFDTICGANVTVPDIGKFPKEVGNFIEMIIKEYTKENYELIGMGEIGEKINYNICFKA